MDGWMYRGTDEWMDRWIVIDDGWVDGQIMDE